jgi:hypothetical protein
MIWNSDRAVTVATLEHEARALGTFVDRAIVREIKLASSRFAETEAAWMEVLALVERWKGGRDDLEVLSAFQSLNRTSTCWKDPAPRSPGA